MCLTYVQYYIYKRRGDRDVVFFVCFFFLFCFVVCLFLCMYVSVCTVCFPSSLLVPGYFFSFFFLVFVCVSVCCVFVLSFFMFTFVFLVFFFVFLCSIVRVCSSQLQFRFPLSARLYFIGVDVVESML